MRAAGLLIALIGLVALPLTTKAASSAKDMTVVGSSANIVQVAEGCGPGFHWVGGYRGRYGRWVPGHCARN